MYHSLQDNLATFHEASGCNWEIIGVYETGNFDMSTTSVFLGPDQVCTLLFAHMCAYMADTHNFASIWPVIRPVLHLETMQHLPLLEGADTHLLCPAHTRRSRRHHRRVKQRVYLSSFCRTWLQSPCPGAFILPHLLTAVPSVTTPDLQIDTHTLKLIHNKHTMQLILLLVVLVVLAVGSMASTDKVARVRYGAPGRSCVQPDRPSCGAPSC